MDILQARERMAAFAVVKGKRWYAKTLLAHQRFPNAQLASRLLIENSRKLLAASRQIIRRSTNTLVCGRSSRTWAN
jgi:hypothetical protein